MCNGRNHSICYTTTRYEVHTFKNKNKVKSLLRDIFVYHFLFNTCLLCSCKFGITETRAYDIVYDENAMSSSII